MPRWLKFQVHGTHRTWGRFEGQVETKREKKSAGKLAVISLEKKDADFYQACFILAESLTFFGKEGESLSEVHHRAHRCFRGDS